MKTILLIIFTLIGELYYLYFWTEEDHIKMFYQRTVFRT